MATAAVDITAQPWRPRDTFSARLRLVRHDLKLHVEEAAELCGIPHPTWSTWENGAQPRDKVDAVSKIVRGFRTHGINLDGDWLLKGGELTPPSTKWFSEDGEGAGHRRLYALGQVRLPGIS